MIAIALGSNLTDRENNIKTAINMLANNPEIRVHKVSSLYETDPVGVTEQPSFLNAVIIISSSLSPHSLIDICLQVEKLMGRKRELRWGPRIIDIDILLMDNLVINTPELEIPHPRMYERRFVLVPLAEIAGDETLPIGRTTNYILNCLPEENAVHLFKKIIWNEEEQAFV